jgi:hypothetical protein
MVNKNTTISITMNKNQYETFQNNRALIDLPNIVKMEVQYIKDHIDPSNIPSKFCKYQSKSGRKPYEVLISEEDSAFLQGLRDAYHFYFSGYMEYCLDGWYEFYLSGGSDPRENREW